MRKKLILVKVLCAFSAFMSVDYCMCMDDRDHFRAHENVVTSSSQIRSGESLSQNWTLESMKAKILDKIVIIDTLLAEINTLQKTNEIIPETEFDALNESALKDCDNKIKNFDKELNEVDEFIKVLTTYQALLEDFKYYFEKMLESFRGDENCNIVSCFEQACQANIKVGALLSTFHSSNFGIGRLINDYNVFFQEFLSQHRFNTIEDVRACGVLTLRGVNVASWALNLLLSNKQIWQAQKQVLLAARQRILTLQVISQQNDIILKCINIHEKRRDSLIAFCELSDESIEKQFVDVMHMKEEEYKNELTQCLSNFLNLQKK